MWSHFHHKSLWYSSPPVQLSVFKPYTKERKWLRPGALSLFYLINTHHHTTHSLLTHVYVSWTHITIHHSKLTTQGSGWKNHCEAILAWRLSPVQFPPLDPHNPWTSKVSSARTLEHIWKPCYRLFLFFWIYEHLLRSFPDNTGVANELVLLESVKQVIRWYIALPISLLQWPNDRYNYHLDGHLGNLSKTF